MKDTISKEQIEAIKKNPNALNILLELSREGKVKIDFVVDIVNQLEYEKASHIKRIILALLDTITKRQA